MKRFITIMTTISVLTMPLNLYGEEARDVNSNGSIEYEISIDEIENMKDLTFEEAVIRRMEQSEISYEEAYDSMKEEENIIIMEMAENIYKDKSKMVEMISKDGLQKNSSLTDIADLLRSKRVVEYKEYEKTQTYSKNSGFKAKVCATIIILNDYSNKKVISGVAGDVWSRPTSGLHTYDWVEGTTSYEVSGNKKTITILASGYFKVEHSAQITLSGFYASGSVGGVYYYSSDNMNIVGSHTVY